MTASEGTDAPSAASASAPGGGRGSATRWRHSLYARSALFIVLGAGSILGAVTVMSSLLVERSVDRLLDERIDLARTAGAFLESRIETDLDRLARRLGPALGGGVGAPCDVAGLHDALDAERVSTLFQDGAFALDERGRVLAVVPEGVGSVLDGLDLPSLLRDALARGGVAASQLVMEGPAPALVVLHPMTDAEGRAVGAVGGLLHPEGGDVLAPAGRGRAQSPLELQLVDRNGTVVAATDQADLFQPGDHDAVLATAIRERRDLKSRCHSCHGDAGEDLARSNVVLAFAPLPSLDLGLAALQPESLALAPAFELRRRVFSLGLGFVGLFVVFAGLSVHSVVRPITVLTNAVHLAEAGRAPLAAGPPGPLPAGSPGPLAAGPPGPLVIGPLGQDEVGELARALELWRSRTVQSLAAAEEQRLLRVSEQERRRHQRQFLHRVLAAQEDERRRVARDLHDTLAQDLAALRLEAERLAARPEADGIRPELETLEQRSRDMLKTVRRILLDLRLSVLESMGLLPALSWLLERHERDSGVRTTLLLDGDEVELEYEQAVTLYRIVQESLQNAVQHGRCDHAFVTVAFRPEEIVLTVEDDGRGFDVEAVRQGRGADGPRGLGLLGMDERARLLGGTLELVSAPGQGAVVRVQVPLRRAAPKAPAVSEVTS